MKPSFSNNSRHTISTGSGSTLNFEQEGDESLFYSAADTLKYSDRSPFGHVRDVIITHSTDQSDYEEGPKASAIYLEPTTIESSDLPNTISSPNIIRKYKDFKWSVLFIVSSLIWFFSGIIISLTTNQNIEARLYHAIERSIGIVSLLVSVTLLVCVIWVYCLSRFTKKTVWATVAITPILLFSTFIWILIDSFQSSPTSKKSILASFLLLAITIIYIKLVSHYKHNMIKTISIIEYVFNTIHSNTAMFTLSFLLLSAFTIFTTLWLTFFKQIWLLGFMDHDNKFIVKNRAYVISSLYIIYYLWACSLLVNIQRFSLSLMRSQWYFHRYDPNILNWKTILTRATTTSFGTLVLCSLILRTIHFMVLVSYYFRKFFDRRGIISLVYFILDWFEDLSVNHYIVSFIGMTEDSFFAAIETSNSLFRRNLLTGKFSDPVTQFVIFISPSLFSICSGVFNYVFVTRHLELNSGVLIGALTTMIIFFVTQFFSYLILSNVDSGFLCYAIDLDTGNIHSPETHTIYSYFD